jgi:hydroxymethylbilane synthase
LDIIKIGTRNSKLALWQARHIKQLLKREGLESELITMETKGDKILHKSISKIGSKGVFTEELEDMLYEGQLDIAVHSAKDLPSTMDPRLELIAFTKRERVHDVVISFNKDFRLDMANKWLVGTSSTRRTALLKLFHSNVRTTSIRGNLQTRMRKLEEGQCDALLLAYAGVYRMGYTEFIVEELPAETFTPAAGQGSIAIQATTKLSSKLRQKIRQAANHEATELCIQTERAFLREIEGGCSVPVFSLATLEGEQMRLNCGIVSLSGKKEIRKNLLIPIHEAQQIAAQLAKEVLQEGGDKILEKIKARR